MHRFLSIPTALLALSTALPYTAGAAAPYSARRMAQLEDRLNQMDAELAQLARFTTRKDAGSIGWGSLPHPTPDQSEWAEVVLAENTPIDLIVLVPVLWNYADTGPRTSGFPEAFEVTAGAAGDALGRVIARFGAEDRLLPRTAPLAIHLPPTAVSWVRVRSTRMSRFAMNNSYAFCLAEIMLFSGGRNAAQHQAVRVSSTAKGWGGEAISADSLTDGSTPFLMDAAHGRKSRTYLGRFAADTPFSFIIDLEEIVPVDEIRFHSASDVRQHIPLPKQVNYGIPPHLVIEGACRADLSDAAVLLDYHLNSIYDAGPILVKRVPETRCRYIRLSLPDPFTIPGSSDARRYVNFSELEIISNGRNAAKGKNVTFPRRGISHLHKESITDGSNNFGIILPIREWMEQLARRHDLERERPLITAELNAGYARQKIVVRLLVGVAAALAATTVLISLLSRILRMRQAARLKQRFSADLHDELGANLHAIGLLGDLAKRKIDNPETLSGILDRIRQLTERSGNAARHCADLLEAQGLSSSLPDEMKRSAGRLLADAEHEFHVEGDRFIQQLSPRKRSDLFLFHKECLTNILRHSQAAHIATHLCGSKKEIRLTVTDDGLGVNGIPPSLKRRARLLRAQVSAAAPADGGTVITLRLRTPRQLLRSKPEFKKG